MNLFEKIQQIRIDLKKKDIKMTGRNDYSGYDYFELDDFLTPVNELMSEYKMTAIPSFNNEFATLTAINLEDPQDRWVITSPFGGAQLKGCHEVQNIGAVETYQRRYLYQALFDIAESDALNKTQGKPTQAPQTKPTQKPQQQATNTDLICSKCEKPVSDKVAKYSEDKYGKVLCYDCQQAEKGKQEDLQPMYNNDDLPF